MNQSSDTPAAVTPTDTYEEVSLLDYLAVLVTHLRLIVLIVVVTVATAVIGVLVATPTYTANTTILPTKGGGGNPLAALGEVAGLTGLTGLAGGAAEGSSQLFPEILRNRMFDAPELQLIQGRLTREVTIQQELFITLKKQRELAKIEEIKETPVVNVLDPAVAPLLRTTPKRRQTVMLAGG